MLLYYTCHCENPNKQTNVSAGQHNFRFRVAGVFFLSGPQSDHKNETVKEHYRYHAYDVHCLRIPIPIIKATYHDEPNTIYQYNQEDTFYRENNSIQRHFCYKNQDQNISHRIELLFAKENQVLVNNLIIRETF